METPEPMNNSEQLQECISKVKLNDFADYKSLSDEQHSLLKAGIELKKAYAKAYDQVWASSRPYAPTKEVLPEKISPGALLNINLYQAFKMMEEIERHGDER